MAVTPADLPVSPDGSFLYCECCGSRYSATRGDYFWAFDTEALACEECSVQLVLAVASERISVVRS